MFKDPFYKRTVPILIGIFILSVIVRLPTLNRPLSKHHEFCTAVALRVLHTWSERGIDTYEGLPVMTYPGEPNKHINNHASSSGEMKDESGNFYYVSHPPFGYYFPHTVFSLFQIKPTVASIQIFNLGTNVITAFFIYFTICLLGTNRARSDLFIPGLIGYGIYLFNPATLWFQSNVYMSDTLVHGFFVIGVYTALKMFIRQRFRVPKYLITYLSFVFLMCYTSWLGYFFAFSAVLYSLIKSRKNKEFLIPSLIGMGGAVLAMALTIWQYGQIAGYDALQAEWMSRAMERGSLIGQERGWLGYLYTKALETKTVLFNYITSYLPIYFLLIYFTRRILRARRMRIVFTRNGYRFLWLSSLPIILLHFTLLNYSGHDFTTLYGSLFLSVLVGIMFDKIFHGQPEGRRALLIAYSITIVAMIAQFYFINRPGEVSLRGDRYEKYLVSGESVMKESHPDEVVFLLRQKPMPELVWYAKRNIQQVYSRGDALKWMDEFSASKGVIIELDEDGQIISAEHLPN